MIYYDITDYLAAKERYFVKTPYRIVHGIGFSLVRGEWVSDEIYNQHNTIPVFSATAPSNPDTTNISQSVKIRKYR